MSLARLRHQMLIAMGIPACWTGPSAPPPAVPQETPPPKVATGFDGGACPRDTIVESVCGSLKETIKSCGKTAANLDSVDEARLYVTMQPDAEPGDAYRGFVLDREATKKYRDDLGDPSAITSCCYSRCTALAVGVAGPVQLQPGYYLEEKCMPAPPNGTSKPAKEDRGCPVGVKFEVDTELRPYAATKEGECCYSVPTQQVRIHAIPGRALRVDGEPCVADVAHGDGWDFELQPNLEIDAGVRARLARVWRQAAQLEHASIAAFASLALRLVAAGAPAQLIAAAHAAALDEVKHARMAFELASAYAGQRLAPGRFDAATRAATGGSIAELALETFVDGCINETAAAHQAEVAASRAADPVVAAALREIADDEARHAALAWAVVAWCIREGAVSLDQLRAHVPATGIANARDEDLAAYGVLGDLASAAVRENVLREVVDPCIAALAA